jgi:tellurite methyltransferase
MIKDEYEKIYSGHKCVFGMEPSAVVKNSLAFIKSGRAIDLGAGEGRNSLFLAEKGFKVIAIDCANVAIKKLEKLANKRSLKINTVVGDISSWDIPKEQNLIIAVLVFHHLSKNDALIVVNNMKLATIRGGINVLEIITKDSDFYRNNVNKDRFYAEPNEVKTLYKDWAILEFNTRHWEAFQKQADGRPLFNNSAVMIARKA